jgi:hypothetical protein
MFFLQLSWPEIKNTAGFEISYQMIQTGIADPGESIDDTAQGGMRLEPVMTDKCTVRSDCSGAEEN